MFAVTASTSQEAAGPLGAAVSTSDRARPANTGDVSPSTAQPPSAAGRLRLSLAELKDAASALSGSATWRSVSVHPSATEAMAVSASAEAIGNHTIEINQVATGQEVSSASFSSLSTVVGIGTLDIQLGTWNGSMSTFSTNPNWPKASVVLGPRDSSLEQVRDRINAAGVGVLATVVSDATGSRLVLRSTGTGADHGFRVEAHPAPATDPATAQALAQLQFDPSSLKAGMSLQQPAADAQLRIDGRDIRSASNLVTDATSGLTIALQAPTPTPQRVQVQSAPEKVAQRVGELVDRYNQVMDTSAGGSAPPWQQELTDSARRMQGQLDAVGLNLDAGGKLQLDAQRLQQAIANSPDVVQQALGESGLTGSWSRLLPGGNQGLATEGESGGQLMHQRLRQGYAFTDGGTGVDAANVPTGSVLSIEA